MKKCLCVLLSFLMLLGMPSGFTALAEDPGTASGSCADGNHVPGNPVRENYVPPTCTEEGSAEYVTYCTVCGDLISREIAPVLALGHGSKGYDERTVPSNCAVRGYYMKVCLACGEVVEQRIFDIDYTAHDWTEWEIVKQASEKEEGLARRVCTRCHTEEEQVIPRYEEDENGAPASVVMQIVEFFENTVVNYAKGIIDWFLRLFGKKKP